MSIDQFVPADEVGIATLTSISGADRLNTWMFETIQPFVKGKTLEIGSGIGNISTQFVVHGLPLSLSDYSDEYCQYLQKKFAGEPLVQDIVKIDLVDKDFETRHARLLGSFDTIFALNVVEHIEDDGLAVVNCYKLLAPGGHLILLMPAYQALYNGFDKGLGHYRRYTRSKMDKLLSTKFEVLKTWHFNLAGILGWFLFGTLLRGKNIKEGQMNAYDKLVGIFRLADKVTFNRIGLSVLGVGKKK
ncbi:MAG TPA: class I SAM-dependent methyltransferase [Puia sp.]|jgi:2-polyprenyl-3-methyl-5-hydroxy-6-metoxy-1,4-benzoquinol methylase